MTSRVCFHTEALTAEMIRNLLEQYGLHPLPLSSTAAVKSVQGVRGFDIEVPDQEAELATEILSEHHHARQFVVLD